MALGFVVAPIFTSLNNSYELTTAGPSVHGFNLSDGLKFAGRNLIALTPFFIGLRFLYTDSARTLLLKAVPSATLLYSIPMLIEMRISPQLHRWVYGYFPHESFAQQMRAGGFRPVVFFQHGLALALFTSIAMLAALIVMRKKRRIFGAPPAGVAVYLGGLLVLCKSLAPAAYGLVFVPVIVFTRPRFWVTIGCVVSLLICAYPLLRKNDLAPIQLVSNIAQAFSQDLSDSFQVRVQNETQLLAKANEKPWFGWGGWGRNRIYDEWTGQSISVTDGGWIIYFGVYGWLGYLSLFGLFAVAMFRARAVIGKEATSANVALGGLALLLAIYLIDAVPNALQETIAFLMAGCIAGMSQIRRFGRNLPQKRSSGHLEP
jgi:hypothetical protein